MKILITFFACLLLGLSQTHAATVDRDSLKQQISVIGDSLKAPLYSQIARDYMSYDTISNKKKRTNYQNEAISYTLMAIQLYSRYNDTTGLRTSFDDLATVYRAQKKFSQAKWFILQSNSLSRVKNDVPNIISSLLILATIKTDIKDYTLAMRDLNEAARLAADSRSPKTQSIVQLSYVMLYNNMQNYPKADIALKRYNAIIDSMHHSDELRITAAADSVQHKKKLYLISAKKVYKASSGKKIALL